MALHGNGSVKRGFATIKLNGDESETRYYDLRGSGMTLRRFTNWANKTFPKGTFTLVWGT